LTEQRDSVRTRTTLLRLGHRIARDKRVTTHLFLAARALGMEAAVYSGTRDRNIEETIMEVCKSWGGIFSLQYTDDYRKFVKEWRNQNRTVVHLTMYGIPIREQIEEVRNNHADKLIIVGGEKVPREIYDLADWNTSVSSQPHSEVSALSIFLHELFEGRELEKEFVGAKQKIVPQKRGKKVVQLKHEDSRDV